MSYLNFSLSTFENSRTPIRHGYTLREINPYLRVLARTALSVLNLKVSDLTAKQAEQVVTDTESNPRPQESTPGCRDKLSESEYQHLVELGHWHHARQRRRKHRSSGYY